jgi:NAD(P)-dependent dehydrogenase (short-subunit alcohol dehydrogenase family)
VFAQLEDALAPGAKVLVLSSLMGSIALRQSSDGWLYRASKAAVNSVLKDVSLHWAGRAICVCAHPGWVRTDMGGPAATLDVTQSVQHLRALVERLKPQDHGKFFNVDGQLFAW